MRLVCKRGTTECAELYASNPNIIDVLFLTVIVFVVAYIVASHFFLRSAYCAECGVTLDNQEDLEKHQEKIHD